MTPAQHKNKKRKKLERRYNNNNKKNQIDKSDCLKGRENGEKSYSSH
jgi:hypothetical protein